MLPRFLRCYLVAIGTLCAANAAPKNIAANMMYLSTQNANVAAPTFCGGQWTGGNTAVDGFEFLFSSGNIASGSIKIYGRL